MSGRGRKLTPGEVNELRALAAAGISDVVIATGMGLNRATIARFTTDVVRPRTKTAGLPHVEDLVAEQLADASPILGVDPGWEPACMDAPELEDWRRGKSRGCIDCTIEYSDQMKLINRCNGIPGPLLEGALPREEEPMTDGLRSTITTGRAEIPSVPGQRETPAIVVPAGREIPIALGLPCGNCIHNEVCAIKATLDRLDTVPVVLPKLHAALRVELSADVECSFFKRATRGPGKAKS